MSKLNTVFAYNVISFSRIGLLSDCTSSNAPTNYPLPSFASQTGANLSFIFITLIVTMFEMGFPYYKPFSKETKRKIRKFVSCVQIHLKHLDCAIHHNFANLLGCYCNFFNRNIWKLIETIQPENLLKETAACRDYFCNVESHPDIAPISILIVSFSIKCLKSLIAIIM